MVGACARDYDSGRSSSEVPAAAARSVGELQRALADSWMDGDLARFMEMIDTEATVQPPGTEALEGSEMVRSWAAAGIGVAPWIGPPADAGAAVESEIAFVTWVGSKNSAQRRTAGEGLRGLAAYRRGSDERWRLLRLVWNRPPRTESEPGSPAQLPEETD